MKYDYLAVGSGLYGAIFAHEAKKYGKMEYRAGFEDYVEDGQEYFGE